MSFQDERTAIIAHMAQFTSIPMAFENQAFDPPPDGAYGRVTILTGAAVARSLGASSPLRTFAGVVQVDLFTPEHVGTGNTLAHADALATLLTDQELEHGNSGVIVTRTASLIKQPVKAGWHHMLLSVPYVRRKVG